MSNLGPPIGAWYGGGSVRDEEIERELNDPATTSRRLAEIAVSHPKLRHRIVPHPNAYPGLIEWIHQQGASDVPEQIPQRSTGRSIPALTRTTAPVTPSSRSKFFTRTKVIVSSAIAVVGAVASVVSVIPLLTQDPTNFSHLEISAQPSNEGPEEWALPPESVVRLDFPADGAPCGAGQREWLTEHAVPLERRLSVEMRNTATEGPMLALADFKSSAEQSGERGALHVRLVCDPEGRIPEQEYFGRLHADKPSLAAKQVRLRADDLTTSIPEIPITFNLAPGESGQIPLELFSQNAVSGALEVSVLSRDEVRTVHVPGSKFTMPSLLFGGDMYLRTGPDGLVCRRNEPATTNSCTIDELLAEYAGARP